MWFQPINNTLNYNFSFQQVEISAEPTIKNELKKFFSKNEKVSNNSRSIYEIFINGHLIDLFLQKIHQVLLQFIKPQYH